MDNLEKFFRDRALQKDMEFHEADWEKLKKQLDKEMPVSIFSLATIKEYWWIPVLILTIPVTWFAIGQFGDDNTANGLEMAQQLTETTVDVVDNEQPFAPFSSKSDISAENISPKEDAEGPLTESFDIVTADDDLRGKNKPFEKHTVIATEDRGYVVLENGVKPSEDSRKADLHFLSSLPPDFMIDKMVPTELQLSYTPKEEPSDLVQKASKNHGMAVYLGLGYSPDFSTVGLGNFTSPGARWEFVAEVGFTPRLLLQTGMTKVHNKYTAYGEDYHAPYGYWKNGVVAEQAYGKCDMIDVPLNLRYTFLIKNRHQLFISGGASTYFLTKEIYQFDYSYDDPDLPNEWSTDKMSVYPFGIINISMGYQYNVGYKGAFQVEPFIKIPTSGIGWGKVDLHTIGAYFVYKYRIGK